MCCRVLGCTRVWTHILTLIYDMTHIHGASATCHCGRGSLRIQWNLSQVHAHLPHLRLYCMYACRYMYVYMYSYMYVCMQIWLILSKVHVHWPPLYMCWVYACTYMYVCMLVCKYLLIHIYVYEFNRTCSKCMHTYRSGVSVVFMCVGTCMHVRGYVYIYSYV